MEYIQGLDGQISVFLHSLGIGFLLGVFYDAVCAVRALRRASPPSSGGQARVVKGFSILQREHRGTGTRLRRSDRRLTAAIWPKPGA